MNMGISWKVGFIDAIYQKNRRVWEGHSANIDSDIELMPST